jgi:hypothetical protein
MVQETPMQHPDLISQIAQDRQRERIAAAAVHGLVASSPARARVAHSLRRLADRLDAATASPAPPVRSAFPCGGRKAAAGV